LFIIILLILSSLKYLSHLNNVPLSLSFTSLHLLPQLYASLISQTHALSHTEARRSLKTGLWLHRLGTTLCNQRQSWLYRSLEGGGTNDAIAVATVDHQAYEGATPTILLGFFNGFLLSCNGFSLGLVLICFLSRMILSWVWDGFSSGFGLILSWVWDDFSNGFGLILSWVWDRFLMVWVDFVFKFSTVEAGCGGARLQWC